MTTSVAPSIAAMVAVVLMYWLIFRKSGAAAELLQVSHLALGKGRRALLFVLSFVVLLLIWDTLSRLQPLGLSNVPSPFSVLSAAARLSISGELISEGLISLRRIIIGFVAATLVGVPVGLLAGSFLIVNRIIVPANSFLRYIPPTAFISLLIVYFGIAEPYKLAVIFFGVIFFIIQMVVDVVDDIDLKYIELALTSGFGKMQVFFRVIVPAAMPRVFDVLRINLSAAWTFLVAAEIIGSENGLGHLIAVSQRFLRIDELFVGILSFGIIGLVTDKGMDVLSRMVFRWYYVTIRR